MRALVLDMVVPGIFATGLSSQTFLPGAQPGATLCLDALTVSGQIQLCTEQSTLQAVCKTLNIDPQLIGDCQAALCWLAEFDQPLPPWVAICQPVQLGVGRTGVNLSEASEASEQQLASLLTLLQPVAEEHGMTLHLGGRFKTLFIAAQKPLDVTFPTPDAMAASQLRHAGIQGDDAIRVNRLRTDFEMALFERTSSASFETSDSPLPNSLWLWGASTKLPAPCDYSGTINAVLTQDVLYAGLAQHIRLGVHDSPFESGHGLYIETGGSEYVRNRNIEKWYQWVIALDENLQRLLQPQSRSIRATLTDPLGARFDPHRRAWPWLSKATFFERVTAVAGLADAR